MERDGRGLYGDVVDPDFCTIVHLDAVPVFGLAWPVLRDTRVANLQITKDDISSAFDDKPSADNFGRLADPDDGLVASDGDLVALWLSYQGAVDPDDETAVLRSIRLEFLVGIGVDDLPAFAACCAPIERGEAVSLVFTMSACRVLRECMGCVVQECYTYQLHGSSLAQIAIL